MYTVFIPQHDLFSYKLQPRKLAQAVTLCILEVPGSNLNRDTNYHARFLVVFLSHSRQMPEQYLKSC
jgi:hypothetical protein